MHRRWIGGLLALTVLLPIGAGAMASPGDPVADRFGFPVGSNPSSPTISRYQAPNGATYMGWVVRAAASFLSPAYGQQLQPGEDWSGRGGGVTDLGQPVYASAAGTIVAAGYYGPDWGYVMLLRHTLPGGQVVLTQYAYMADIAKTSGTVAWREVIGHIGTGRGGAVLHFEVRQGNLADAPADYWPTSDNKDADWVRQHYYSPTQFVRTHTLIASASPTPTPPSDPSAPPGDPPVLGGGPTPGGSSSTPLPTVPGTITTVPGPFPLFPNEPTGSTPLSPSIPLSPSAPLTPPVPSTGLIPVAGPWDGVAHLDGSVLRSGTGIYYLLQSGKKWRITGDDVLATWARPAEALPASDAELASYPDGSHPLGLRLGAWFQGPGGPLCIGADPFNDAGLACWVVSDDYPASFGPASGSIQPVSKQTMGLYIRPTPFTQSTPLPRGVLIQQPYGGYYIVEDLSGYLPEVHPVTSTAALHSWELDESMAVPVGGLDFWGRALKLAPVPFRPGSILRSSSGQLYVVSGEYKYAVTNLDLFARRGYNAANAIPVTDAELALEKDWPTPLP